MNVNKKGRSYPPGKALDVDLRSLIIDHCLKNGGDPAHLYLPVTFESVADKYSVTANTVSKIWKNFCLKERTVRPAEKGGDRVMKFSDGDLELIEVLKTVRGSVQLREIRTLLEEVGDVENISLSSISKAIKSKLLSGKRYTRKKITHVAKERFTPENMAYTQLFINYISSKDLTKIKFFDEAGIKTPGVGTRLYGNSPVGTRCVEITRKAESPNATLNLLISVDGPVYFNVIDGATNTIQFWNFFLEASEAVDEFSGRPAIEVGDTIVMDNCAVHHFEGGEYLEEFLAEIGVELIYTPTYSPDLNPIELCFNEVKTELNGYYSHDVNENLKLAVSDAICRVTPSDARNFYYKTSYLFPTL